MKRRIVAAGLLAAALTVTGAASAAPVTTSVAVASMPRGADVAVAWIDGADRSIHAGGSVVPTNLASPARAFRSVTGGFLVEDEASRLFHVSTTGVKKDLGPVLRFVVRTGRYAGSQFVTERQTANGYRLEVRRSSDLSLVRGRTFPSFFHKLDFHDGVVWVRSGKWLFNTNEFVRVDRLVRAHAQDVEARVNAFAGRPLSDGALTIAPLYGTPWSAWPARNNAHLRGWSPDGRFVVLNFPHNDDPWDDYLEVRNARTGARVARFSGTFTSHVKWEDATHFLVAAATRGIGPGGEEAGYPTAIVRLGADGSAQRASDLNDGTGDGPFVLLISERS